MIKTLAVIVLAYFITIQSVQLKNDQGKWHTVIEPDHVVDLEKAEPGVSFFNNGRVPAGNYVNFKLVFLENSTHSMREITGKADFSSPVKVEKGSFIGVWFKYLLPSKEIEKVSVFIDDSTRVIQGDEIRA